METKTYFRVIYKDSSYASENFNTIEEAIKRANERSSIRIDTTNSNDRETFIWSGDLCTVVKVVETIEYLSMVERYKGKTCFDI